MDFKAKPTAPKTINTDSDNTLVTKDYVDVEIGKLPTTDTTYTAGTNISIDANNKISATDTTYTAGANISISGTTISATDTNTTYSEITTAEIDAGTSSTLRTITGRRIKYALDKKVDTNQVLTNVPVNAVFTDTKYTAGTNVSINTSNIISATDTTYTAGSNISIANNVISASNLVTTNTTQTLSASKTIESTAIVLTTRRKADSSGIYAGLMMERDTVSSSTTAPAIFGVGGYFKAKNTSGSMTFAGLFGGRLTPAVGGETTNQVGEVVFSPAWDNKDPYQRADFRIRATSASSANTYLTGDMYVNSSETGKNGNKVATENYVDNAIPVYTAGTNISIVNGLISATDTITTVNGNTGAITKNDITALGIPAQDTTYTAGANISISNGKISATDTNTIYSAGTNISIDASNKISATDTKYTAGTNISINNNVISAELKDSGTSADWLNAKYKIKIINGKPYLEVVDV